MRKLERRRAEAQAAQDERRGSKKWFNAKVGGNDDCPLDCTDKKCTKKSKCLYSHVNK